MNSVARVGEHCFGCTACKHLCPVGCIRMKPDEKGFLYPIVLDAPDSPYYALFLKGTTLRPSCYACPFCSFDRPGDITIGDFWGIEDTLAEFEDEKGVSLVLVNSQKGEHAFQGFSQHLEYIRSTHEACLQPAVSKPTPPGKDKDMFWQEYALFGYPYVANKYGRP